MINCVSNLAWVKEEENKAIKILKNNNINYLEFAPNLLIKNKNEIKKIKKKWAAKGIKLYSMQSILFGEENAFIFGSKTQNEIFFNAIKSKINLANKLNVKIIIFGSPRNRKTFGKRKNLLNKIFIKTFKKLSKYCKKKNVIICVEPNPKIYKSEYLNNMDEVIKIIKKIKNKFIKINYDLGASIANKENIKTSFQKNVDLIGHVQISAPGLGNLNRFKKDVKKFSEILQFSKYKGQVSMEVLAKGKNNIKSLKNNIKIIND